jgi:hypothetical protein
MLESPNHDSITDATTLKSYINIFEERKNGITSLKRNILLQEKASIQRLETTDTIDAEFRSKVQEAREKMKDIQKLLSPNIGKENQESLSARIMKCKERPPLTFCNLSTYSITSLSEDMKTATNDNDSIYDTLMGSLELTSCSVPIKWSVKLAGSQKIGDMCVGVAHKSFIPNGHHSYKSWVIFNNGLFYFDDDETPSHGHDMKDAVIEIMYEPKPGRLSFTCKHKQFQYIIPESCRKELVPAFGIGPKSSMTIQDL